MVKNKRAEGGSSLGLVITIVLLLLGAVFVIYLMSDGFKNFRSTSSAYSGDSNVDDIKVACEYACTAGSEYEYCNTKKKIDFGVTVDNSGAPCTVGVGVTEDTCKREWSLTCEEASDRIGASPCSTISCPAA